MKTVNEMKAYEMGVEFCKTGGHSSPALNQKFISWIDSEYNSWEDKVFKAKTKLYKAYSKGWTEQSLA